MRPVRRHYEMKSNRRPLASCCFARMGRTQFPREGRQNARDDARDAPAKAMEKQPRSDNRKAERRKREGEKNRITENLVGEMT